MLRGARVLKTDGPVRAYPRFTITCFSSMYSSIE
jgi:hypothetical protein